MQLTYIILLRTGYNSPYSVTKTFPHVTYHRYSKIPSCLLKKYPIEIRNENLHINHLFQAYFRKNVPYTGYWKPISTPQHCCMGDNVILFLSVRLRIVRVENKLNTHIFII